MDTSRIVGQSVTHISYGAGKIVSANDKQIQVQFESGELKKYQYPQAFISYLQIDDKSLMSEILIEEQIRKQKEDEEKKKLREKREIEQQGVDVSSIATGKKQTRNRSTSKTEPRSYDGVILDRNTSYITHAETLNTCFGYHYVHFQKAYKDLDNGYAVWFPRIAKKVGTDYLSSDSYWGWLNIMSEDGDTITQMDNPDFPYSGEGPDKNMRIIFSKFGEIYWNLILKHGLRQKAQAKNKKGTYLEQILYDAEKKYRIVEHIPYESLTAEMMIDITHQIKIKCKRYVVGALYEDTNHLFYSFSKKEERIQINPVMYEFVCKHKTVIEKLNYYEWAKFLERVNEESSATKLLDKIDKSAKRNNLSFYRQILFDEFESKNCFYCGKPLSPNKVHVDHFIPWSFIKDDNLWNLVLACPSCNAKKNDKLPVRSYLDSIIERNRHIIVSVYIKPGK